MQTEADCSYCLQPRWLLAVHGRELERRHLRPGPRIPPCTRQSGGAPLRGTARPGDVPGVGPVRCVPPRPERKVKVGRGPPLGGDFCVLGCLGLVRWGIGLGGRARVPSSPGWHSGLCLCRNPP